MGIAKPAGGYAEQMLEPGGWPDVDEDTLYDRAREYTQVLQQVTGILDTCQHQRSEIFDGGVWSGRAANAANSELTTDIGELTTLQHGLTTIITWGKYIALSIVQAKADITDNVESAHHQISVLERDSSLDAAERTIAINEVIAATYGANVTLMESTAERIRASKAWEPPGNALDDLLDQKTPPPVSVPEGAPQLPTPVEDDRPHPGPADPRPVTPPIVPVSPPRPSPATPTPSPRPTPAPPPAPPPAPGMPATPGQPPAPPMPGPGDPRPAVPGTPGTGPAAPVRPPTPGGPAAPAGPATPAVPLAPATPAAPLTPAASAQPAGGGGKGMAPASAAGAPTSPGARAEESSAAATPAGGAGMPAAPMGAGSGSAAGGSGARSGARPAAPAAHKPSSTSPTTRPAAAARPAARPTAAQVHSADHSDIPDEVAPPPIVPVSAARAERDAVADAADATRRGGPDPLQMARRIGAALNAPGSGGEGNLGFFWVTAVTTDGAIVVANSYGLAYIPEGVQLPDKVHMASADGAIPSAERARWATYPVMAVQGWANHHDKTLRAVIATEQQLAGSDPGATKIVLSPEDIPETGAMVGRSRLQVVDADAADRLAATSDPHLIDLLPPAPAGGEQRGSPATSEVTDSDAAAQLAISVAAGSVDADQLLDALPAKPAGLDPPADERPILWFDVVKPMASKATGRTAAHLRAFHKYAAHAQEVALADAYTAADLAAQRSAVADWLYWKHLTELLATVVANTS